MIECKITCPACGMKEVRFAVRVRANDEDVIQWLEGAVRPAAHKAHMTTSPDCRHPTADLFIPFAAQANARIGDPSKH